MRVTLRLLTFFLFALLLVAHSAEAQDVSYVAQDDPLVEGEVARLYSTEGKVEVKLVSAKTWQLVKDGAVFKNGDVIKVGRNSRAGVLFADGMLLRLSENAIVKFESDPDSPVIDVQNGEGHFFSRDSKRSPRIKTPMVNAAIFGTEFVVKSSSSKTEIAMIDGVVEVSNDKGTVRAEGGELVVAGKDSAPTKSILVKPFNSVQWAIQVPILLETGVYEEFVSAGNDSEKSLWLSAKKGVAPAAASSERGRIARAYYLGKKSSVADALAELGNSRSDSAQLLRLQLLLQVGQVQDAKHTLEQLEKSMGNSSDAKLRATKLVSEAFLAFSVNDTEKSANLLAQADALDPEGLNVGYLDSLLAQLNGDIDYATSLMSELAYRHPSESSVHARLAELYLAQGERKKARREIEKAQALPYGDSYAYLVKGFLELAERNHDQAKDAFLKVVDWDSSNAEAHLGLGLVAASQGDLEQSQSSFKKAVHLAPQRSVYRSYLGKAFFEDDSEKLARDEYSLAIELDEDDPTPYLYRAFTSLSENKLVPALNDVEESIKRNSNRAVYRSRFLLDQDLGVRSASLARVFNDLGFSEVARLEAIKSINYDYFNYSAHRLLSDALVTIQDADASFSERRIADILSPLSFNFFNSSGEQASANEYNALFDKDEERTSVFVGGNTVGDVYNTELLHAGKSGEVGYALSYDALYGLGERDDDYLRNNRFNAAFQYQPHTDHKFLFDGSYQYFELKDEEGSPINTDTQAINSSLAYVYKLSPRATLITEAKYNLDSSDTTDFDSRVVSITSQSDALDSAEILDEIFFDADQDDEVQRVSGGTQYIYQGKRTTSILGGQYLSINTDRKEHAFVYGDEPATIFDELEFRYDTLARTDLRSYDTYAYNVFRPVDWFTLDVGLAYSRVEYEDAEIAPFTEGSQSNNRFNPKFGLHIYPVENLTVRAAYFESLRKSVLEDQVAIEPVIVGGFTQRFNDVSGSVARTTAVGADYKVPGQSYFGVEAMDRHVVNPFTTVVQEFNFDFSEFDVSQSALKEDFDNHIDQDFLKGWWYQVLSDEFVATSDYYYYRNRFTDPDVNQTITSHRTSLSLRHFMPNGFFTFARSTWRQQDRLGSFFFDDGTADFWVHDLGVGYRFPDRHGSIRFEVQNILDKEFEYDQFLGFEEPVADELSGRLYLQFSF